MVNQLLNPNLELVEVSSNRTHRSSRSSSSNSHFLEVRHKHLQLEEDYLEVLLPAFNLSKCLKVFLQARAKPQLAVGFLVNNLDQWELRPKALSPRVPVSVVEALHSLEQLVVCLVEIPSRTPHSPSAKVFRAWANSNRLKALVYSAEADKLVLLVLPSRKAVLEASQV